MTDTRIEVVYLRRIGMDRIADIVNLHTTAATTRRDDQPLLPHAPASAVYRALNQLIAELHNELSTNGDTDALRAAIITATACATIVANHTANAIPLAELKGLTHD